ncbi:MAG TPA: 4Fe-4S binding protein [Synergistaceae bacterium]|nr:4Fe-4S binding protein [Synergistaceae bacterium]HPJ26357.1 4Fe-4S binding protein [Synergistaceae bacterium]HPQ36642.1 4Fe-4S binding protein [Synergistaceae bacterium]
MSSKWLRRTVQIGFLIFISWVGYQHQLLGGGSEGAPAVDALCPLGGLESLYVYLQSGAWLRRVAPSALVLFGAVVVITLLVGRVFCGWICPLGTVGEGAAKLGSLLKIRKRELPPAIDRPLRYLKYVILILIIGFTWKMGTLVWRDYDPWVSWMHLSAGWGEFVEKPWGYVVLFVTVIGASMVIERFWCRYLCPLGALLAPLQKLGLVKVRRDDTECVHCHLCGSACPVGLDPESKAVENSAECIACGKCVEACPKSKALFFGTPSRKLSVLAVGLLGVIVFFGIYGGAKISGYWQTSTSSSVRIAATNPADKLYGWMSIQQIAAAVGLSEEKVLEITGLGDTTSRDISIKEIPGVDDEDLREILFHYFEGHEEISGEAPRPVPPGAELPNPEEIKGSMTASEVATLYGLSAPELFKTAGWPEESDPARPLKDIAGEQNAEVSEFRDAVRELLEKKE